MYRRKNLTREKVRFVLQVPEAKRVTIAGDFNGWNSEALPLRRNKENVWIKILTLKPGRYEYKFVVDGNWVTDPNNTNKVKSPVGGENSVIEVF